MVFKCESCFYGSIEVKEGMTRELFPKKYQYLSVFCRKSWTFKRTDKLISQCEKYLQNPEKIQIGKNKNVLQVSLIELV